MNTLVCRYMQPIVRGMKEFTDDCQVSFNQSCSLRTTRWPLHADKSSLLVIIKPLLLSPLHKDDTSLFLPVLIDFLLPSATMVSTDSFTRLYLTMAFHNVSIMCARISVVCLLGSWERGRILSPPHDQSMFLQNTSGNIC